MNLEALFETRKPLRGIYRSWRAEIEAVAAGKKGIASYGYFAAHISDNRGALTYLEIVLDAFARGLLVVLHPVPKRPFADLVFDLYVTRPGELWRVPAQRTFDEERLVAWEDATTMYQSALLGYTHTQTRRFVVELEQRELWRDATYVLLTKDQVARVNALGRRGFDDIEKLELFRHRAGQLRRDVRKRIPRGLTLAAFHHAEHAWLFPEWSTRRGRRHLFTARVDRTRAPRLHNGLRSAIRFLGPRGWV